MESIPRVHATRGHVLSQHRHWLDRRHLKTLAWMIVGLQQAQAHCRRGPLQQRRPGLESHLLLALHVSQWRQ
jgi:hypothetical protein